MLDFHKAFSSIRALPIFRPPSISPSTSTPFLAHPFLLLFNCTAGVPCILDPSVRSAVSSLVPVRCAFTPWPTVDRSIRAIRLLRLVPLLLAVAVPPCSLLPQEFWTFVYHPVLAAPKNRIRHLSLLEPRPVNNLSYDECLISDHTKI